MKVSVIIPTFNEEKVISSCLSSLKKQTYKDIEIIVVDDGSTDRTSEIVEKYKVKFASQKHKGPAEARNLGARYAKGKILVFVDSDMTFDKDFIKNLIAPIIDKKAKGTFSKEEYVQNWENVWARSWNINSNLPKKRRLPKNYPDHQKVFRAILRTEFDRVYGFSHGGYTDDGTLAEKLNYEAINAPNAIFYHSNPDNLKEVWKQAKWVAKREYKFGILGALFTLLESSIIVSIVIGLIKSIINLSPYFIIFKIVYDFGIFIGILELFIIGKTSK